MEANFYKRRMVGKVKTTGKTSKLHNPSYQLEPQRRFSHRHSSTSAPPSSSSSSPPSSSSPVPLLWLTRRLPFSPALPAAFWLARSIAAAALFRCVSACFIMWSLRMKPLPHCSQAYGLEPLCRHMWRRRSVLWLNCFGHCSHLNGFSPPCLARCSSYDWLHGKRLPHR
uniref:Uncharacterized protein n=1 Tax=Anopheles atroparvus TaxID=41427 RepID=A0A182IYU3_ANOAO